MEDLKQKIFDILLNYTYENRTTAAEEIAKLFHEETQQGPIWVRLHDYKFKETGHHPYRYRTTENDEYDYGEIYVTDDAEGVFFDVDHENEYEPQNSKKWLHYEILDESGQSKEQLITSGIAEHLLNPPEDKKLPSMPLPATDPFLQSKGDENEFLTKQS